MLISSAYAQSSTAAPGGADFQMWLLPLMFIALIFFTIVPQRRRQKEMKAMLESLQKGDEVVVAGGIVGKITKIQDAYMNLEVAPNIEILVQRSAVTTALPKGTMKSL